MSFIRKLIILNLLSLSLSFIFITSSVTAKTTYEYKIHEVLKRLPPFWAQDREEHEDDRAKRLAILAQAVDIATSNPRNRPRGTSKEMMSAALMTIAFKETALARNVNNGKCDEMPRGQRCDMDHNGKPRARTYFQLWAVACPRVHAEGLVPGSQEELNIAAECASKRLTSSFYRCAGKNKYGAWPGAYAGYRSIDCTYEPESEGHRKYRGPKARAEYMMRIKKKLSHIPARPKAPLLRQKL